MLLNSEQIAKFVTESAYSKRTQAGIDLSVMKIQRISFNGTEFPQVLQTKTDISPSLYEELEAEYNNKNDKLGWMLSKGVYSVTFNEGINVPNDCQAKITHRSSLFRVGNIIESPWWDAGFYCDNMNTTLIINTPTFIEANARLAQIVFYRMEQPATETYNGQWQGLSNATK